MARHRWTFVLTELDGTRLGELTNASGRQVRLAVNKVPTAQFTVMLDHRWADRLLGADVLVKAYRDGQLIFHGPVNAAEESSDGIRGSVAVVCSGAAWRLDRRLIGKDATGYRQGTALAPVDRSTIAAGILAAVNADAHTGIDAGTITASGATTYVEWAPYKPALEAINELCQAGDGPDWQVRPVEPAAVAGGVRIGLLDVVPYLGASRPQAVFELGDGKRNVAGYRRQLSADTMVNAGYGLPPSDSTSSAVLTQADADSIAAFGRLEAVIPNDLAVDQLRQKLVDEHVRVRARPRQTITFTPIRTDFARPDRVPEFGGDYGLGDAVPFRVVRNGTIRIDASLRVYAVEFAVDAEGAETPTLTLTPD